MRRRRRHFLGVEGHVGRDGGLGPPAAGDARGSKRQAEKAAAEAMLDDAMLRSQTDSAQPWKRNGPRPPSFRRKRRAKAPQWIDPRFRESFCHELLSKAQPRRSRLKKAAPEGAARSRQVELFCLGSATPPTDQREADKGGAKQRQRARFRSLDGRRRGRLERI